MKTIKLSEIKLNSNNPRSIGPDAFARLVESIKRDPEYLCKRGIVVADGVVLGGNQRYSAIAEALKDGNFREKVGVPDAETIPAGWIQDASEWPDDKRRRFVVVDNAPDGMAGEWNIDALAAEFDINDLCTMGFDANDFLNDGEPAGKMRALELAAPVLTWVLICCPTRSFGSIAEHVEKIGAVSGVTVETAVTDGN